MRKPFTYIITKFKINHSTSSRTANNRIDTQRLNAIVKIMCETGMYFGDLLPKYIDLSLFQWLTPTLSTNVSENKEHFIQLFSRSAGFNQTTKKWRLRNSLNRLLYKTCLNVVIDN